MHETEFTSTKVSKEEIFFIIYLHEYVHEGIGTVNGSLNAHHTVRVTVVFFAKGNSAGLPGLKLFSAPNSSVSL